MRTSKTYSFTKRDHDYYSNYKLAQNQVKSNQIQTAKLSLEIGGRNHMLTIKV